MKFAIYSIPSRKGKIWNIEELCVLTLKKVWSNMEARLWRLNYFVYEIEIVALREDT